MAVSGGSRVAAVVCRRRDRNALARHIGYTAEELAALDPGEVLLDLGSGAGFDAFITLFGPGSGAALATVVGVLVEVPVMLSVCGVCNRTRGWFREGPKGAGAGELFQTQ